MRFETIHFALVACPHCAARAVKQCPGIDDRKIGIGRLGLDVFAHACLEYAFKGAGSLAAALVQALQIPSRPECVLEFIGLHTGASDREKLAENVGPAHQ